MCRKMKIDSELKGLAKSFTFAFRGIRNCILGERNMRIHIVIAIFTFLFSFFYNFSKAEYIVLLLTIALVISCEMMNTAVEAVVDLVTPSYNKIAQIAKDIAAGAVLISALTAIAVGFILFFDLDRLGKIFIFFKSNPQFLILLALLGISGLIFIFKGTSFINKNKYKGKN